MRRLLLIIMFFMTTQLYGLQIPGPKGLIQSPEFTFGKLVYVPLSSFAQAYGLKETWNPKTKIANLASQKINFSFRDGSQYVVVNARLMQMPAQAKMVNGRLTIPFQFGLQIFSKPIDANLPAIQSVKVKPLSILTKPNTTLTIIIDPGHGGYDVGAQGKRGLNEKDINLDISKRVRTKLLENGINVVMTRSRDVFVTLWERANMTRQYKADLFVSIHSNAARSKSINGTEIFFFGTPNSKLNGSNYKKNLTKSFKFAYQVKNHLKSELKNNTRGVKNARYFVLRNAMIPAVLIEVGFISNPWEENKLIRSSYREQIAKAIAQSILDYQSVR